MKFWDLSFCDCCYIRICLLYSPRMWRWSHHRISHALHKSVFSTYVEVILVIFIIWHLQSSILHVCGGDPFEPDGYTWNLWYSPRMWRWSLRYIFISHLPSVFSTYVEVILIMFLALPDNWSILHVCGGDPMGNQFLINILSYSPRMWRWSLHKVGLPFQQVVFSTYVEVIPWSFPEKKRTTGILHVCGGDPLFLHRHPERCLYSPRMWRWSQAGLQQTNSFISILHVCGGDPISRNELTGKYQYSPRMWRWSYISVS